MFLSFNIFLTAEGSLSNSMARRRRPALYRHRGRRSPAASTIDGMLQPSPHLPFPFSSPPLYPPPCWPPRTAKRKGPFSTSGPQQTSLLGGNFSEDPFCSDQHLVVVIAEIISPSHQTLLAHAGSELPNSISPVTGITPNSPKETTALKLLFTRECRAPLPSSLQPASPAARIRGRAGPDLALSPNWAGPCRVRCAFRH